MGINGAIVAMYCRDDVVCLAKNQRLMRYVNNGYQILAEHINVHYVEQTHLRQNKFYYVSIKVKGSVSVGVACFKEQID